MDRIKWLDDSFDFLKSLPVVSGYYLVLGGGKIGSDFVEYANNSDFPFVLIIDSDPHAPASRNSTLVRNISDVRELIRSLNEHPDGSYGKNPSGISEVPSSNNNVYFYCMDIHGVPSLLNLGIPEFIIPAVPTHATANMVIDSLRMNNNENIVSEFFIGNEETRLMGYFENLQSRLPENVIAGSFPESGVIMLSYARDGEICPDNCMGQANYCYNFRREKPETITSYVGSLLPEYSGWVFESCQMKAGIGGIRGADLKQNTLSIIKYVKNIIQNKADNPIEDKIFFVATTCNCHGVLNLLYVV